jgi:superfamily II DNA or RNA helicase
MRPNSRRNAKLTSRNYVRISSSDEAHHAEARTWKQFKAQFEKRRVLQFTATPFRDDDRLIDGKIIYRYPLRQAQQDGYFRPIMFRSVFEFNETKADRAIAEAAISELDADASGLHVAMARALDIPRAKKVFEIYKAIGRYNPVLLHSKLTASERRESFMMLKSGESRIVYVSICSERGSTCRNLRLQRFTIPERACRLRSSSRDGSPELDQT